jgi:hypothetical protein
MTPPSRARRVLSWSLLAAIWLPVCAVTLLVWAWRDSDDPSLAAWWMASEVALAVAVVALRGRLIPPLAARVGWAWAGLAALVVGAWLAVRPPADHALPGRGKKVAVVGAGAGGMHAAWMLDRMGVDVAVFEAAPYVGGHAYAYPFEGTTGRSCPSTRASCSGRPRPTWR